MEQYIQPFVEGSEEVFRDLCNTEVKAGRAFFVSKDEFETIWDISGIIGLSGEANGAVALSLKEPTAIDLTKILTGSEHDSIDKFVTDAMGEIINIIAGNVKNVFEKKHRIKISMPSIIKGKAHSIVWPSEKARIICIPFTIFNDQEFCLSVAMEQTK
ncbi:MAG: chemotaxis protein CheX [Treponema sp.]|nr:chemotaxis protein CheX [Treponema sp.]